MRAAHGQCPGFSDLNLYGHSMVPAAFSVAGTCVFIGSVCSGVPGWLFPVGCSCSAPVVSARLPAIPARLRLFPPGFGCSCAVSGCSRLVVPVRLWLFLPRLRLPFLDFSCPAPALLPPPGFGCSRPVVGASCRRSLQKKSRMFVPFRIFSYI